MYIYISLAAITNSDKSVKGQIKCGSQYHFTMETQNSLVVPHEDGYTVYSSTQWVTDVQLAVANVLGVPNSRFVGEYLQLTCVQCLILLVGQANYHVWILLIQSIDNIVYYTELKVLFFIPHSSLVKA